VSDSFSIGAHSFVFISFGVQCRTAISVKWRKVNTGLRFKIQADDQDFKSVEGVVVISVLLWVFFEILGRPSMTRKSAWPIPLKKS
jgi:hypothetical protein